MVKARFKAARSSHAKIGLSLIESLVVIGLLLVLFAIVYPVTRSAVANAKDVETLNNLSQISKAAILYCVDHDDKFPIYVTFHDIFEGEVTWGRGARMWVESLTRYGAKGKVWFSPADPFRYGVNTTVDTPAWQIRPYTSYAHVQSLRSFRVNDYFVYSSHSVAVPSKYIHLYEEGWINVLDERGFGRTLPNNGKDYGCMYMDGSVRRLTWSQLTAKPE